MYAVARRHRRNEQVAYRTYVCDSLRMAPQGMYLAQRYSDIMRPRQDIDVDAIIDHVVSIATGGD